MMSAQMPQTPPARPGRAPLSVRAAAALLGAVVTAGCGAGFNAASLVVRPNAGAAQDGSLRVNNVWVVLDPATGNAELIGAIANTGRTDDRLTSAKAGGFAATVRPAVPTPAAVALPVEGVTVEGGSVLFAGGSSASFGRPGGPQLELRDTGFSIGHFTRVELDFERAGPVAMNVLIMPNTGLFAEYDPNGISAAGSSPTASTPSASGSASASPSPSPSPSLSPSVSAAARAVTRSRNGRLAGPAMETGPASRR